MIAIMSANEAVHDDRQWMLTLWGELGRGGGCRGGGRGGGSRQKGSRNLRKLIRERREERKK